MRLFIAMLPTLLLASAATDAQTLSIARSGSRPIRPAPADNFTGTARVDTLFETQDPLSASAGSVSFEPGARTAWHSHPAGQILIVTAGTVIASRRFGRETSSEFPRARSIGTERRRRRP
jgi:4-carboxymuconolactone decarboxylase